MYRPGERSEGPLADKDCNKQDREEFVTPPRSEGPLSMGRERLRCAQHDKTGSGRERSSSAMRAYMRRLRGIPDLGW